VVVAAGLVSSIDFQIFGHRTNYFEGVVAQYPQLNISLQESDQVTLEKFFEGIDVLVSVADLEGFGRPISSAMIGGIPCYLLRKPVFLEFFGGAFFFNDIVALVDGLRDAIKYGFQPWQNILPPRVTGGYHNANQQLRVAALDNKS